MLRAKWIARMLADVVRLGVVNRSPATSVALLVFLVIALAVVAAHVATPLIYTLF